MLWPDCSAVRNSSFVMPMAVAATERSAPPPVWTASMTADRLGRLQRTDNGVDLRLCERAVVQQGLERFAKLCFSIGLRGGTRRRRWCRRVGLCAGYARRGQCETAALPPIRPRARPAFANLLLFMCNPFMWIPEDPASDTHDEGRR
jgi:hypothetical protein